MAASIASPLLAGSRIAAPASGPWRQGARRGGISIQANYDIHLDKNKKVRNAFEKAAEYLQKKRQGKLEESVPGTNLSEEVKNDKYEFKAEDELEQEDEEPQQDEGEVKEVFGIKIRKTPPGKAGSRKMKVKIISKEGVAVRETERPNSSPMF